MRKDDSLKQHNHGLSASKFHGQSQLSSGSYNSHAACLTASPYCVPSIRPYPIPTSSVVGNGYDQHQNMGKGIQVRHDNSNLSALRVSKLDDYVSQSTIGMLTSFSSAVYYVFTYAPKVHTCMDIPVEAFQGQTFQLPRRPVMGASEGNRSCIPFCIKIILRIVCRTS